MKTVINILIPLICLFFLASDSFAYEYSSDNWTETPSEYHIENVWNKTFESIDKTYSSDFFNTNNDEPIILKAFDPNEDDETVGGRVPIQDGLILILLLTSIYCGYKKLEKYTISREVK